MIASTALALPLLVSPSADADKGDDQRSVPSRSDVYEARSRAQGAAAQVAAIQAELVLANQQLEDAAVRAEQAFEAYNGAQWRVQQATAALHQAVRDARRANREVFDQRGVLAGLVAASYQDGGDVSVLNGVLGAEGPEGLMSQMLAFEGASGSVDAQMQRFGATATLAEVFQKQARRAKAAQVALLEVAEEARDAAASAAAAAEQAATSIAARKSDLVRDLARLQGISVTLAEQRQTALEEIERRRAAAEAQAQMEAQVVAGAGQRSGGSAGKNGSDEPTGTEPTDDGPTETAPTEPQPEPTPTEPPPSVPVATPPPVSTPPVAHGGAARAIAFARAQLGDPYVWAAAGPDAWDCSGLTMGAWQTGGVSLPHYSVAQYAATTPISAAQLRPGDLVFWGSSSSPGSIHHVAMYLGDGLIIHAPRTGRPVSIDSMYYWVPPNFFSRV